jgi:hypothetical protein
LSAKCLAHLFVCFDLHEGHLLAAPKRRTRRRVVLVTSI